MRMNLFQISCLFLVVVVVVARGEGICLSHVAQHKASCDCVSQTLLSDAVSRRCLPSAITVVHDGAALFLFSFFH